MLPRSYPAQQQQYHPLTSSASAASLGSPHIPPSNISSSMAHAYMNNNMTTHNQHQQHSTQYPPSSYSNSSTTSNRRHTTAPQLMTSAWYGSEYLTSSGMVTSKKEGDDTSSQQQRKAASSYSATNAAHASAREKADRERAEAARDARNPDAHDHLAQVELTPSAIAAPLFPYMGRDSDGAATNFAHAASSSTYAAASTSFGGWNSTVESSQHDQPLLRFLPNDERIEQLAQQLSTSATANEMKSSGTNPSSLRRTSSHTDSSDTDSPSDAPTRTTVLRVRASSARFDSKYSPALLHVTNTWWTSCVASNMLVSESTSAEAKPIVSPTSRTTIVSPTSTSPPPLLPSSSYAHLRMLIYQSLLPDPIFHQRLSSLAMIIVYEYEDLRRKHGLGKPQQRVKSHSASHERKERETTSSFSSPSSPVVGLTLPIFHTALCELVNSLTTASTVAQYSEFLGHLYLGITIDASPRSPPPSPTNVPAVSSRRFLSLPTHVAAVLTQANEEMLRDQSRARAAIIDTDDNDSSSSTHRSSQRRKQLDRDRIELKEMMCVRNAEMMEHTHQSTKRITDAELNRVITSDPPLSIYDDDARGGDDTREHDAPPMDDSGVYRSAKESQIENESKYEEHDNRATTPPLLHDTHSHDVAHSRFVHHPNHHQPPPTVSVLPESTSPRPYLSSSDIRRSARHTLMDEQESNGGGSVNGRKKDASAMMTSQHAQKLTSPRSTSQLLRSHHSNDSQADDPVTSLTNDHSATYSSASTSSRTSSNNSRNRIDRTLEEQEEDGAGFVDSSSSSPSFYSQHPPASSVTASTNTFTSTSVPKQPRSHLSLQQQAAQHRSRLAHGRTHKGHVLPAYIANEEQIQQQQQQYAQSTGIAGVKVGGYSYGQSQQTTNHRGAAHPPPPPPPRVSFDSRIHDAPLSTNIPSSHTYSSNSVYAIATAPTQPSVTVSRSRATTPNGTPNFTPQQQQPSPSSSVLAAYHNANVNVSPIPHHQYHTLARSKALGGVQPQPMISSPSPFARLPPQSTSVHSQQRTR